MKTVGAILGISSLLLTLVAAAPLDKRVIVWHTVTHQVIETVDVTTTITVGATGKGNAQAPEKTTTTTTPTPAAAAQSEKPAAASSPEYTWSYSFPQTTQKQQAAPSADYSQPSKAPEPTTTSSPPPPPPVEPYVPPPPPSSTPPPPPPPPSPSPAPSPTSVAPSPSYQSPLPSTTSAPTGGQCSPGSPCTGEITFFDTTGTLACGNSGVNGEVVHVVALPHGMMGPLSNNNPYCGRKITITRGDKSCEATVMDKCMGCTGESIDLSRAAFRTLADEDEGRVDGIKWVFSN